MKIYRNYDGNKSTFGDTSIRTTVPNPDVLSAFGAVRTSDGALTLMVINKDINNASPIHGEHHQLQRRRNRPTLAIDFRTTSSAISPTSRSRMEFSATCFRPKASRFMFCPRRTAFNLQIGNNSPPGQLGIWLNGQAGQTYILQSSADLVHWSAVSTNQLTSNSFEFFVPTTNAAQMFYRGVLNSP